MISRVLSAALVAGFLAACVASVLQFAWTTPLIVKAETYERHASASIAEPTIVLAHVHEAAPKSEAEEWKPAEGLPRTAFTGLATLVSGVGYALLLLALMLAAGREPDLPTALRWAVGGFVAANLAPAIGLPPELPGMASGALEARQVWWLATAAATALGLWLILRLGGRIWSLAGLALLIAPHLLRIPHAAPETTVPPGLAAAFVAASLAGSALFWALVSSAAGFSFARLHGGPT